MFQPDAGLLLDIGGEKYRIASHPAMPKMPYGQEGKQAVVFKVEGEQGKAFALKVFKPRYRKPYLVTLAERMGAYAYLTGLEVCERKVINPIEHAPLLQKYPDLVYAVLMPWVEGPTWSEKLLGRKPLEEEESHYLARCFLKILISLEERGLSHGDISGMNVMLPYCAGGEGVSLVDVEQLYIPGMEFTPEILVGQSPGYSFPHASKSIWGPLADRFAGAVVLAEMLCYCEKEVVKASWGESYFSPDEMGQDTSRYRLIEEVLVRRYGEATASLFRRAWFSMDLESCPTFAEWYVYLLEKPVSKPDVPPDNVFGFPETGVRLERNVTLQTIMDKSAELIAQGDLRGVAELYQYALTMEDISGETREQLEHELQRIRSKLVESKRADVKRDETDRRIEIYPVLGHIVTEVATEPSQAVTETFTVDIKGLVAEEAFSGAEAREGKAWIDEKPTFLVDLEPASHKKRLLIVGISVALAITLFILVSLVLLSRGAVGKIAVPEIQGLTVEEAEAELAKMGLLLRNIRYETSDEVGEGLVISSDPPPGSLLAHGDHVDLIVSGNLVDLPDVAGVSLEEARSALEALGLAVEVEYRESDSVQSGICIGTEPSSGSQVDRGSNIRLLVSSGPPQQQRNIGTGPNQQASGTCPTCGGGGRVSCSACGGRGYISVSSTSTCSRCGGRGFAACTRCGGSGFLPDGRVCDLCSGRGTILCPSCGGSGRVSTTVRQTCSACGGSGTVVCPTCHGSGKLP